MAIFLKPSTLSLRRLIIFLIGLLTLMIAPAMPIQHALAYNCENPYGHCYSINQWYSPTGYYSAAKTSISISQLYSPGGSCPHINVEEWLSDAQNGHDYWVEAGLTSGNDCVGAYCPIQVCYFWEDERPGSTLIGHVMGAAQSNDYNNLATFQIANAGSGTWSVNMWAPSQHDSSSSTSNNMSPNNIQIGGEVEGTSGESAPYTSLTWNTYNTGSGYSYFTSDGNSPADQAPWSGGWGPAPSQTQGGGTAHWNVSCGCNG